MRLGREHGFPMEEFLRLRIGPVVMKDEVEYFREVGLQQEIGSWHRQRHYSLR